MTTTASTSMNHHANGIPNPTGLSSSSSSSASSSGLWRKSSSSSNNNNNNNSNSINGIKHLWGTLLIVTLLVFGVMGRQSNTLLKKRRDETLEVERLIYGTKASRENENERYVYDLRNQDPEDLSTSLEKDNENDQDETNSESAGKLFIKNEINTMPIEESNKVSGSDAIVAAFKLQGKDFSEEDDLEARNWILNPNEQDMKYFVYQPSGGWGNQRLILRWAKPAATAMERPLISPLIAPHSFMWYGYEKWNRTDMVIASKVLDMDAMNAGLPFGVRVLNGTLAELRNQILRHKTWSRYTKPQTRIDPITKKPRTYWLSINAIKHAWRYKKEDVVFWQKGSMWMCCAGGDEYTPYIMFHRRFKLIAARLILPHLSSTYGLQYNAIHVRRAQGHTRIDRRTADYYFDMHIKPAGFDKSFPLYVATDEKNLSWFDPLYEVHGFKKLIFWKDLDQEILNKTLEEFPLPMQGDFIGFIEQLICGFASNWTGSDGSTFSFSIMGIRRFPTMTNVNWQEMVRSAPQDSELRKIFESIINAPGT